MSERLPGDRGIFVGMAGARGNAIEAPVPNVTQMAASVAASLLRRLLARMPAGGRSWLARQMMHDRFDPATGAFADFCEQAIHAWKNRQYVPEENGEAALLARLAPFRPSVLIDVGANVGDWTLAACRALPEATVHAFEIAAPTVDVLARNVAPFRERVVINPCGLADGAGEVAVFLTPENDTAASTLRSVVDFSVADQGLREVVELGGRVITGDAYLREHGIAHVAMLKIDVEGAEFSVLRGFSEAFGRGAIDVVQFEYGALNLITREFLGDFWWFLTARGFVVGKLYPEGVAFKDYEIADEDFVGPNYIACRADRPDIVAALRCPVLTVPPR